MTRQEIIDELRQIAGYSRSKAAVCREAADLLERDVVKLVHASWRDGFCTRCGEYAITEWSECGGDLLLTDFCPFCGAKMDGERRAEDEN